MGGTVIFFKVRGQRRTFALLLFCCLTLILSGCGRFGRGSELDGLDDDVTPVLTGEPVFYTTTIVVEDPLQASATPTAGTDQPAPVASGQAAIDATGKPVPVPAEEEEAPLGADDIRERMEAHSQLVSLAEDAPDSIMGLERRAGQDRETALTLLHSLGFYDGEAYVTVDRYTAPVKVTVTLKPGVQYTVGRVEIVYDPEPLVPEAFKGRTLRTGWIFKRTVNLRNPSFPRELRSVKPGDPALADTMLDAVDRLPLAIQNQGYPLAQVASTRYTINRQSRTLDALIVVDTGFPAIMGEVRFSGLERVKESYLERLVPWQPGRPWNQNQFNRFREGLQNSGLFSVVDLTPALSLVRPGAAGNDEARLESPPVAGESAIVVRPLILPVNAQLREGAPRTIAAELAYSTENGIGVRGTWEHRNLFGAAEKLRFEVPISDKLQAVRADFSKPFFFSLNQRLLMGAAWQKEETDAYDTDFVNAYVGIERSFTRRWRGSARLFMEDGTITEDEIKRDYRYLSLQTILTRDTRNNALNPTRGSIAALTITPYTGSYDGNFQILAAKLDASVYFRPLGHDRLVLAARGAAGTMFGADGSYEVPASIRYYAGGGGSVRGYAYQAIGPRDYKNDPKGGSSFTLTNLEARLKFNDTIGMVAFLDGGAVYEDSTPDWGKDWYWGAGLGFRYYSPIGPVRLDVGFPLKKIKGEDPFQLYISIGQAF